MGQFVHLQVELRDGIARVILNRPERRNAFDAAMVGELRDAFEKLGRDSSIRGIVLTGAGPAFCAGADLRWMSPASPVPETQARADADLLMGMYRTIDECPCPVIGRVQGPAFGGGVGLVACCDIVVAAEDVTFALSEVQLGLVPAIIAPFLLRKAGDSFVRRYCLTAESFSAPQAKQFNLVHDVVAKDRLDGRTNEVAEMIVRLAPQAVRQTKMLFRRLLSLPEADLEAVCVQANVQARLSAEAQEGLRAFLDKRPPAWAKSAHEQQANEETARPHDVASRRA